jgi:hypothetical protein
MLGILFPAAVLVISLGLTLFLFRHFSSKKD